MNKGQHFVMSQMSSSSGDFRFRFDFLDVRQAIQDATAYFEAR